VHYSKFFRNLTKTFSILVLSAVSSIAFAALTDGLVILRYLFNLRGDVLINDVIASDATVKTAEDVEAKIEQLIPAL
jgi:hypothetical protein